MPPRKPVEERVRERLAGIEPDPVTGCIDWPGARSKGGYGVIGATTDDGRRLTLYVHRLMWSLTHGRPVPAGLDVRHHCDRRSCCAPEHLGVGSRRENMGDAVSRDRIAHGEGHHASVLTAEDAIEICLAHDAGATMEALAAEYGVSVTAIHSVISGGSWWRDTGRSPAPKSRKRKKTKGGDR